MTLKFVKGESDILELAKGRAAFVLVIGNT
ncbi:MAG: hypothetical protein XD48_0177, partial [Archaeoglobus fulgidus]